MLSKLEKEILIESLESYLNRKKDFEKGRGFYGFHFYLNSYISVAPFIDNWMLKMEDHIRSNPEAMANMLKLYPNFRLPTVEEVKERTLRTTTTIDLYSKLMRKNFSYEQAKALLD